MEKIEHKGRKGKEEIYKTFASLASSAFILSFVITIGCLALGGTAAGKKKTKVNTPEEAIRKILPKNWTMETEGSAVPLLWKANVPCQVFTLRNPTKTHTHPIGGFDYQPSHTFWVCPVNFVGSQFPIGMVEQRYPANYIADGAAGVLFHYSMGDNDWGSAPDDVVKALKMERPREEEASCKKALSAIEAKAKLPGGMSTECNSVTTDSIFLSLGTQKEMAGDDVDKITNSVVKALKDAFPDKKRAIINRGYGMYFDTVVVGFKLS